MPQYYSAAIPPEGDLLSLGEDEARHIARVARHRPGDIIRIFNGKGVQAEAEITIADHLSVTMVIKKRVERRPAGPALTLCFASLPRTAFEEVLDKATQLGAARIRPVLTAFSERNILDTWESKQPRWKQIMLAAAKQCERPDLPELLPPLEFRDALLKSPGPLFIADAHGGAPIHSFRDEISARGEASIFIGPEGGFADKEIHILPSFGARQVSLGPYVLRAETACAAAIAALMQ